LSPNTVVQPGGGPGTVSARAGALTSAVATTLVRLPASNATVVSTERRLSDLGRRPACPEGLTAAFVPSFICQTSCQAEGPSLVEPPPRLGH
jgi:hypothetical protein